MSERRRARRARTTLLLGAGLGAIALIAAGVFPSTIRGLSWAAFSASLALGCFAGALALRGPEPAAAILQLAPPTRPLRGWGLALAILGILALSHALDLILSAAGIRETSVLARIEDLLAQASAAQLLEAALAMAVAPAVGEELLFRGLLLRRLCERLGPTSGLLLSSLLFGAIHLDLAQGAAAVVLGLYLGALTLRTGSVHAAIFCHGVNNLTAILGAIWKS